MIRSDNVNKKQLLDQSLSYLKSVKHGPRKRAEKYTVIVGSYVYLQSKSNLMLHAAEVKSILQKQLGGVKIRTVLDFIAGYKSTQSTADHFSYCSRVLMSFFSSLASQADQHIAKGTGHDFLESLSSVGDPQSAID
jgi:hypothetical protein